MPRGTLRGHGMTSDGTCHPRHARRHSVESEKASFVANDTLEFTISLRRPRQRKGSRGGGGGRLQRPMHLTRWIMDRRDSSKRRRLHSVWLRRATIYELASTDETAINLGNEGESVANGPGCHLHPRRLSNIRGRDAQKIRPKDSKDVERDRRGSITIVGLAKVSLHLSVVIGSDKESWFLEIALHTCGRGDNCDNLERGRWEIIWGKNSRSLCAVIDAMINVFVPVSILKSERLKQAFFPYLNFFNSI